MTVPFFQNPQLDGNSFFLNGGSTGVLLMHGLTATTVEVRALGEFLNQHGFTISSPLLPGHGTCPEDLVDIKWKDWAVTAEKAYLDLAQKCSRVIVGGESLGALLSLYLAYRYPQIEMVLLYAPALQVKRIWRAAVLQPFIKIRPKGYGGKDLEGHLPWQGYTVVVVPAANQLRKFQKVVRRLLPDVRQPLLIFQARVDRTIDPMGSQVVYNRAGSAIKELVWLNQSGHTVLLDIERESVYKHTLAFLQNGSG